LTFKRFRIPFINEQFVKNILFIIYIILYFIYFFIWIKRKDLFQYEWIKNKSPDAVSEQLAFENQLIINWVSHSENSKLRTRMEAAQNYVDNYLK